MVKISFLGDIALNDNYRILSKLKKNPFREISSILNSSDFVVGNLETTCESAKGENLLKIPRLKTDVKTLKYLTDLKVNLVTLANNHAYDNLQDGFEETTKFLDDNNIAYIGAGLSQEEAEKPFIKTVNNIKFCILNYVTYDTNPNLPEDATVFLNWFKEKKVISDIKKYKTQVDKIILCLHWGGRCEGGYYPDREQPKIARRLINTGADLIIGGHSHTLQPYEIYKGKYIFYSLGNFCFSEVIFGGKSLELDKRRTNPSIILNINFYKTKYSAEFHGIINDNCFIKSCLFSEKKIKRISYNKSILYNSPLWHVYCLYEKKVYPIIAYFFANNRNPIKQLLKLQWKTIRKHLRQLYNIA